MFAQQNYYIQKMEHQVLGLGCIYTAHIQMINDEWFSNLIWQVFRRPLSYYATKDCMSTKA